MKKIEILQKMIDESKSIVFFSGAGVSTESGIKDFRGKDGLSKMKFPYPVEVMLSRRFFDEKTEEFYDFYRKYMNSLDAKPNVIHQYLKKLEDAGKLKAIVTQNIDGLHEKAGCQCVYELHGTIYKNYCMRCHKEYDASVAFDSKGIPRCTCGGIIKPNVVLYGESLPEYAFDASIEAISHADLLIVAGTSLTVYPAAGFLSYFKGKYLVILNLEETPFDKKASLVMHESLGKIFESLEI